MIIRNYEIPFHKGQRYIIAGVSSTYHFKSKAEMTKALNKYRKEKR